MKITISVKYAKEFAKQVKSFNDYVSERLWYQRDDDASTIDISFLTADELELLHEFILKKYNGDGTEEGRDHSLNGATQIISVYKKIIADPDKAAPTNLRDLAPALKTYINKNSKRKFLFKTEDGDVRLPFIITDIEYEEAKQNGGYVSPANTQITMKFIYMDEVKTKSITYYDQDMRAKDSEGNATKKAGKMTCHQLLESKGYIIGTEELCEYYDKEIEIFMNYRNQIGEQFTSTGSGKSSGRYDSHGELRAFNTEGTPHKLVVDEPSSRKSKADDQYIGAGFWDKNKDEIMRIPVHPFIRIFNLKDHTGYSAHTSKLTPYIYKPELIHKLRLPDRVKKLVTILGQGARAGLGDIISGKAEGVIIGCVGAPGLGKSLTAEIYSEFLKRPLYTVQCSQLGTDPDDLEKRLNEVLNRASRWKAVLLLDEADVYIRARGTDILQNAIVGVFLRVIEYYRGIIFMTSNVLHLDDAIESRFTAKIKYPHPTKEMATLIWIDQIENHGWPKDEKLADTMATKYPQLSGRSIRNLTNLATRTAKSGGGEDKLTLAVLEDVSEFVVLEKPDAINENIK